VVWLFDTSRVLFIREDCKGRDLKYPGLILHDMRRTAARNFRRAGIAEGVIMRVGGWRTRSVFERYNIISQADIQDALEKFERRWKDSEAGEASGEFGYDSVMISKESLAQPVDRKTAKVN
jgi:hypothetical protein